MTTNSATILHRNLVVISGAVVAQLTEESLPRPEICGSNPVIINIAA